MSESENSGSRLRRWAKGLKRKLRALYLASRHPQTPWYAKTLAVLVVGYAFSPIDLIPDLIPLLGYLDDAILLPMGIWLTLRLIPNDIWAECEAEALRWDPAEHPGSRVAVAVIVLLWVLAFAFAAKVLWPRVAPLL